MTESQVGNQSAVKFVWKLDNFSQMEDKEYCSDVFVAGGCKWRLYVFPKGLVRGYLSVYVDVADADVLPLGWSRKAMISLAVMNPFNPTKKIKAEASEQRFCAKNRYWGSSMFIRLADLRPTDAYPNTVIIKTEIIPLEAEFISNISGTEPQSVNHFKTSLPVITSKKKRSLPVITSKKKRSLPVITSKKKRSLPGIKKKRSLPASSPVGEHQSEKMKTRVLDNNNEMEDPIESLEKFRKEVIKDFGIQLKEISKKFLTEMQSLMDE
ncbi:hypothetical protein ACFE04_020867 [Oxalis oulophora]